MYQIFKKEIASYLSSLVAYVTIGLFLLVLGLFLWVFPDSSILDYGYAGLDSLFSTAPFLFMFLIPAITMRTIAEERREGTFELLVTRPLTDIQIVLGKYFACVALMLCALLPTLVYYWSVSLLGTPQGNIDTGAVIGSYTGLFLLGSGFAAIGIFASATTKNQIIAFALAVFLCFFIYTGLDLLSGLPSLQDYSIQYLGINQHYQSVSRGVLDTRDLAYFIVLATLFIAVTLLALVWQRQKKLNIKACGIMLAVMAALLLLANISFTRFDFTKEKRYTISAVSRGVMDSLPQPVKVTVYLKGENFPPGMKRLQFAARDILSDLQAYSHGKLQFEMVDPLKHSTNQDEQEHFEQSLDASGLLPTTLSVPADGGQTQKLIYAGALVKAGSAQTAVNMLQSREGANADEALNNSVQNLEYTFVSAIKKAVTTGRQRIGLTEGHHELTNQQMFDARKSLSDGFEVGRINLNVIPPDSLKTLSLLIIPKPDLPFTELEKFKIDQYLMGGGRLLWSIDQVSAELDSLQGRGQQMTFPKKLNLDDMLFTYGVRLNYDLIADMNCAPIPVTTGSAGGAPQIQLLNWLFYPLFLPMSKHPAVKNLEAIRSEFAGTIDTIGIKNVQKTILFTSSPYNKKFNAPYMLSLQALEENPNPATFQSEPKITGVLLEGSFRSAFLNRPVPAGFTGHIQPLTDSKPTKMVVISDGDIFKNQVGKDGSAYPLGYDHYSRKTYGNKNLLLNLADYLTGDARLIALRTKEIQLRLLNRARINNEKLYWQTINTIGPLLLVLIFAIFQHYLRKRKYAR